MFRFFHADRRGGLAEGATLELRDGLSPFGHTYWPDIQRRRETGAEIPPNSMREYLLEEIRQIELPHAISRLRCFFGTNYLEEAIRYAETILPVPKQPVPVFEVYTANFVTLDMSHTNLPPDDPEFLQYSRWYWRRVISNNGPPSGNRTPPQLEVLMHFPVTAGSQVAVANSASASPESAA